MIEYRYSDGGRAEAGYKGSTGDCVARSIAIATELPYAHVYDALNELAGDERQRARGRRSSARTGVRRRTYDRFLKLLGWEWTPTMQIGSGCQVHLRADELPPGRLIVRLSGHIAAVVDGVLYDTYDCSRDGTRCVYGVWRPGGMEPWPR